MSNLILGRYIPGNSWIYQINPTTKIILTFYFTIIVFLANNWGSYGTLWLGAFVSIYFSGIKIKTFFNGIKSIIVLILFTVVIQILFSSNGKTIFSFGPVRITDLGTKYGIFIFFRFTLIIIISTILTISTKPFSIAHGIERILSPLNKIHFPVDVLALMISIALRFIPILVNETTSIIKAQKARGANFYTKNMVKKIRAITSIFIPLFLVSMNYASELGDTMISRGYKNNIKRSQYHRYKFTNKDFLSYAVYLILGILIFIIRG